MNIINGFVIMNKEKRKFKKTMKERKRREDYLKRIKNKFGAFLPAFLIPFRKSRKHKKKKIKNE